MMLMRTTVELDHELLRTSKELTGIEDNEALICEALRTLIELRSARRLALLGGTMPGLKPIPRHRLR